jgi:ubiquitin C-terminal hydrolase
VIDAPDFTFKPRPGQMEDAHEFLAALLDKLNFPKAHRSYTWTHPSTLEVKHKTLANDVWDHLQITLHKVTKKTMQEYFDEEMGQEVLDQTTRWNDTDLSTTPGIIKYTLVSDLDKLKNKMLIIHLKRFVYYPDSGLSEKLTHPVKNPFHLVIKKSQLYNAAAKSDQSDRKYELVGCIKHAGNDINNGHYLAYIKKGATWYLHNDQEPGTTLAFPEIESAAETAYIYFYRLVK